MADRRLSKAEKSAIYQLFASGVPTYLIAQKFNVSEAKIVRVLEDAGYIKW